MSGATHAQIAKLLLSRTDPRVFAHAARDAVIDRNFTTLERMFRGVTFDCRATGPDQWELVGACADGSTVVWGVGA